MGLINRWREYRRQYGVAGLARHLLTRIVRPVWESATVDILAIHPPGPNLSARAPIVISEMTPVLAQEAGLLGPDWKRRREQGHVCYAAWLNGVYVHHSWVAWNDAFLAEAHGWLRFAPGEAYIYDCFTSGSCRGLGIFPAVLSEIGRTLASSGIDRIWIAVERENTSSRRAIERAGFLLCCTLSYSRKGPWVKKVVDQQPHAPGCRFE